MDGTILLGSSTVVAALASVDEIRYSRSWAALSNAGTIGDPDTISYVCEERKPSTANDRR